MDYKRPIEHVRLGVQDRYEELCSRGGEEETYPNCRVKRMRAQMRSLQPFLETVRNASPRPSERRPYSSHEELRAIKFAKEMNEMMREILEDRRRHQLTAEKGFIGPLPRPIGLLNKDVKEGRRVLALASPFLDPLYKRDIVSPFHILQHLKRYLVGIWEH